MSLQVDEIAVRIANESMGQDRAACLPRADGCLLVVADGAGGLSGGAQAAQAVLDYIAATDVDGADWVQVLRDLDALIAARADCGETTAVIAYVHRETVTGASVGDSCAWTLSATTYTDLSAAQRRKPLLGSGGALPIGFGPVPLTARLLVGTDGLFKYVDPWRIHRLGLTRSLGDAAHQLIDAARLPSGALQDDVAIVLAGAPRS